MEGLRAATAAGQAHAVPTASWHLSLVLASAVAWRAAQGLGPRESSHSPPSPSIKGKKGPTGAGPTFLIRKRSLFQIKLQLKAGENYLNNRTKLSSRHRYNSCLPAPAFASKAPGPHKAKGRPAKEESAIQKSPEKRTIHSTPLRAHW